MCAAVLFCQYAIFSQPAKAETPESKLGSILKNARTSSEDESIKSYAAATLLLEESTNVEFKRFWGSTVYVLYVRRLLESKESANRKLAERITLALALPEYVDRMALFSECICHDIPLDTDHLSKDQMVRLGGYVLAYSNSLRDEQLGKSDSPNGSKPWGQLQSAAWILIKRGTQENDQK